MRVGEGPLAVEIDLGSASIPACISGPLMWKRERIVEDRVSMW